MVETLSSTISLLRRVVDNYPRLPSGVTLYLFGSILTDTIDRRDTDVLLVYPPGYLATAHQLAMHLRSLSVVPPIEVVAVSSEEEEETRFVEVVGAQRFWVSSDCGSGDECVVSGGWTNYLGGLWTSLLALVAAGFRSRRYCAWPIA